MSDDGLERLLMNQLHQSHYTSRSSMKCGDGMVPGSSFVPPLEGTVSPYPRLASFLLSGFRTAPSFNFGLLDYWWPGIISAACSGMTAGLSVRVAIVLTAMGVRGMTHEGSRPGGPS